MLSFTLQFHSVDAIQIVLVPVTEIAFVLYSPVSPKKQNGLPGMQVVLVHVAHNLDQGRAAVQRSPALHQQSSSSAQHFQLDPDALAQYNQLEGTPEQLLRSAVYASNQAEVEELAAAFDRERHLYTETHCTARAAAEASAAMAQQAGTSFVDPDTGVGMGVQDPMVNIQTTVQLRLQAQDIASIGRISHADFQAVGHIAGARLRGLPLRRRLEAAEPRVRMLFKLAGHPYTMDLERCQAAADRPGLFERLRTIASNPVACAQYFWISMQAFCEVFLGWPIGKTHQPTLPAQTTSTQRQLSRPHPAPSSHHALVELLSPKNDKNQGVPDHSFGLRSPQNGP
ncbi:hypothetical protein DUNSADRAFT_18201 [Dunaliella salina]|uniref:Encoded protein n=1 Tax=Dunaliella salina TaxID=3046 RepID=A0ABQ7G0G1_DUNSA|nr:hypothetical protein DUNSADRAFT_18201 [Dunaliella salina]|eukprot:KAF5828093.1 hypothetical protein DUNSADRAFT_18201 [Dunaliella salina]